MLITKKMLMVLTLAGALVGAGIGALVTHSASSTTAASTNATPTYDTNQTATANPKTPDQTASDNAVQFKTTEEQTAYKAGFGDGYNGCVSAQTNSTSRSYASYQTPVRYSNGRRVYYDYSSSRRGRTFWQKHRDKLTLGIGTGLGAAIGGLAGGGKGAGIGALAGLGGSALYTYKLRHRRHRY